MKKFSRKSLTAEEVIEIEKSDKLLSEQDFIGMTVRENIKFCEWLINEGRRPKEFALVPEQLRGFLNLGIIRPDDTIKVVGAKVDKYLFGTVEADIAG